MTMTDVMVDLETTGTDPNRHAIIQWAAVKFNLYTRQVDPDVFNHSLSMAPLRMWDEDTRVWWGDKKDVYKDIVSRMEPPLDIIKAYSAWIGSDNLRFWAKPITFDYCFVESYYRHYGLNFPHHYRTARDLNSYIAGLKHNADHPNTDHVEFKGTEHNAVHDTFHQIRVLFDAADNNIKAEVMSNAPNW